jgi:hypothetical protein
MEIIKLMREYFEFEDINQSETINVLPLTISDLMLEQTKELQSLLDLSEVQLKSSKQDVKELKEEIERLHNESI